MKYRYFNDFFDDKFLNDLNGTSLRRSTKNVYPQCNIAQSEDGGFNFYVYVPGFARTDFCIDVKNNVLTAKGKLIDTSRTKYIHQEISQYTSFERSWTLPQEVNVDGIDASYNSGILHIIVPLLQERKPETKTITVQ